MIYLHMEYFTLRVHNSVQKRGIENTFKTMRFYSTALSK